MEPGDETRGQDLSHYEQHLRPEGLEIDVESSQPGEQSGATRMGIHLPEGDGRTKMRRNSHISSRDRSRLSHERRPSRGKLEASVRRLTRQFGAFLLFLCFGYAAKGQQIGKYVAVQAGSEADRALAEINAATDPAQKLALIDKFAAGSGKEGDLPILADGLYVDYYITQKNYDKAFEYGDKLFALDPDSFSNALNMVRAASEKGDVERLISYGEKDGEILKRYKSTPAPSGMSAEAWEGEKARILESNKDGVAYIEQAVFSGAYQAKEAAKRAGYLAKYAQIFPDSPYANQALGVAATAYQQAQNAPKMLEVANGLLAKDPNNLGMLLLLSDYYCDKTDQLDKAETYAKKAISALQTAQKPEGVSDEQWAQQKGLQKGLALSALGQVNIEKKDNTQAVENLKSAAPLLKSDNGSYARNQYRLGFALLNLKETRRRRKP